MDVGAVQSGSPELSGMDALKKSGMGRDAFMRLLVTELTYQDPMAPVDNKDFIAQLAQFSSLEAQENLQRIFEQSAQSMQWSYGVSLIGKTVYGVGKDSGDVSGVVVGAGIEDGNVVVELDSGDRIPLNTIKEVRV